MTIGFIHSIETFGTVDDGGIRFVIFMQGCPMRCMFCHNPDTWLNAGKPVTVDDMMHEIETYKVFFEASGGGVTVSGGEPLLQHRFVVELFNRCRDHGIHRTVDTSGFCKHGSFELVLESTSRMLFSVKVVDRTKHEELTGVDNDAIIENLKTAAKSDVELVVRYVLIPGVNDRDSDINDLASLLKSLDRNVEIDILPYHKLGIAKWEELGMQYGLKSVVEPTQGDMGRMRKQLGNLGVKLIRFSQTE